MKIVVALAVSVISCCSVMGFVPVRQSKRVQTTSTTPEASITTCLHAGGFGGGGMGKMGGGMKNKSGGNMKGNSGNKAPMGHDPAGSGRVYVRGFDFGTKEAQLRKHMMQAGQVLKMKMESKGEAIVVYKNKEDAESAAATLNQTVVDGNSRYIDVILKESSAPPGPPGSGRVFVRGFDFGTTEQQLTQHMSQAGSILEAKMKGKGEANIMYETKAQAQAAAKTLNKSTIEGNTRFIEVTLKDQ